MRSGDPSLPALIDSRRTRWAVVLVVIPVLCLNALSGWVLHAHDHDGHGVHLHIHHHGGADRPDHHHHHHHTDDHAPSAPDKCEDREEGVRVELPTRESMPSGSKLVRLVPPALPVFILTTERIDTGLDQGLSLAARAPARPPWRALARLVRTSCALLL